MQEFGLIEIIPLICALIIQSQCPVLSHPEYPQGRWLGEAAVAEGLMMGILFVSILSSLRVTVRGSCSGLMMQHPLFTDMAGNIFHSQTYTQENNFGKY